jgi:DNA-binding NarL/FixJ family response regulator
MSRVLLVYHHALFAHSIRIALRSAARIHLVGELEDWTRVEAEIVRLVPDVILVEEDEDAATEAVLGMLRARQSPWRVVALRLDKTRMHIWSGAGIALQKPQDLYNALCAVPRRQRKNLHSARRATLTGGGQ